MLYKRIDVVSTSFDHDMPAGSGYRLCLKKLKNHHGTEAEHPTIEKYLRTLMAKKLHGALLVPQKFILVAKRKNSKIYSL